MFSFEQRDERRKITIAIYSKPSYKYRVFRVLIKCSFWVREKQPEREREKEKISLIEVPLKMIIFICTSYKNEMHPVLFELGMLLTKNPISSDAAHQQHQQCMLYVLFSFLTNLVLPNLRTFLLWYKCLSYCLQVLKKCTYTLCARTQCISRIYTQNEPYCTFSSFQRSFSIFLSSSFFHICLSFYFSICFSRIAIIDVLFSLFVCVCCHCAHKITLKVLLKCSTQTMQRRE